MYKKLTFEEYVNNSYNELQDDGTFTAKAHQKRAFENLNHAYDVLRDTNNKDKMSVAKGFARNAWYEIPFYIHEVREKHFKFFEEQYHEKLRMIVDLRATFKETPVVKPEPKNDRVSKKQTQVTEAVFDMIQRHEARYYEVIEIGRLFGGLNVTVTPHQVTNQYRTTFTRCFYFLDGKLTALAIICAALEKLEAEKEETA
tara:strand:- start:291 stop:890 length:600 start_codon:yes stop_codon:yes gene_type:complete